MAIDPFFAFAEDIYNRITLDQAERLIATGIDPLPLDERTLITDASGVYVADGRTPGAIRYVVRQFKGGSKVGAFEVCIPCDAPDHAYVRPAEAA